MGSRRGDARRQPFRRPRPTRLTGFCLVVFGWLIVVLDWLMSYTTRLLLPGGQNPGYVLGALVLTVTGIVWNRR